MKIFCIGRNYREHAAELKNPLPTEPLIFMKPSTALLAEGKPFYHPAFSNEIHHEIELVLKIKKNGKHVNQKFASDYYDMIGLGIDFTARDVQDQLKKNGHPWEIAKAFDHSAVLGDFISKSALGDVNNISFSLSKNGTTVQAGNSRDLIFNFDYLITYISKYFTLQVGDLVYTGTPAGVAPVAIGDKLEGKINDQTLLTCEVK
jgi:acylpyruvate hydrolase